MDEHKNDGKFKEGNKKGRGRPKGAMNKVTKEHRKRIEEILTRIYDQHIFEDLENLKPNERVNLFIALSEYMIPKLQRTTLANDTNDDGEKLSFEVIMNRSQIDEEEAS